MCAPQIRLCTPWITVSIGISLPPLLSIFLLFFHGAFAAARPPNCGDGMLHQQRLWILFTANDCRYSSAFRGRRASESPLRAQHANGRSALDCVAMEKPSEKMSFVHSTAATVKITSHTGKCLHHRSEHQPQPKIISRVTALAG